VNAVMYTGVLVTGTLLIGRLGGDLTRVDYRSFYFCNQFTRARRDGNDFIGSRGVSVPGRGTGFVLFTRVPSVLR